MLSLPFSAGVRAISWIELRTGRKDDRVATSLLLLLLHPRYTLQYCSHPAVSAANKQLRKQKSVKVKIINYSINTRRGPNPPTNPNLSCTTFHIFFIQFFYFLSLSLSQLIGGRFLEISDLMLSYFALLQIRLLKYNIIITI